MTPEVRELLAALDDALDFPTAVYDDMGRRSSALDSRVSMLRGAIRAAIDNPSDVDVAAVTAVTRRWAHEPLCYQPYKCPEVPA